MERKIYGWEYTIGKKPKEYLWRLFWLLLLLAVLMMPPVYSGLLKVSGSMGYPNGSLVMTSKPEANFPDDWGYCYLEKKQITICLILMNQNELSIRDTSIMVSEFLKCGITITINAQVWVNETPRTYVDYDLEALAETYRVRSGSDIALVWTYVQGVADTGYGDLGGYSRVSKHFAAVLTTPVMPKFGSIGVDALSLHEVAHCLGYWHSGNPTDVMYSQFSGKNTHLTAPTITELTRLHNEV